MTAPNMPARMPGPVKLPDPSYAGDDYDRTGCTAAIDVSGDGYRLSIFAPNGAQMERYARVKSARGIARMLEEWCAGFAPRLRGRLDSSEAG